MEDGNLKALLDAPNEEAALQAAGAITTSPERNDEASSMDRATAFYASLSEKERTLVNHFQSAEWISVITRLISEKDDSRWKEAVKSVAAEIAPAVLEATETQYSDKHFSNSDHESVRVKSLDRIQAMSRWTPLRLIWAERELFRLLESTLYISDYTDNVDIYHSGNKNKQIVKQIRQICSILSGLVIARDYEEGQRLLKDRDFKRLAPFFQTCFEIGRRYKQLNPERMRDSYGKLMYFLMDSRADQIMSMLGFDCVCPVKTVEEFLRRKNGGMELLRDPLLVKATAEIYSDGLTRSQVQALQDEKENATKALIRKYAEQRSSPKIGGRGFLSAFSFKLWSPSDDESLGRLDDPSGNSWTSPIMTEEDVELAIYSLKDHMTFLRYNERPVDCLLQLLEEYFDPDDVTPETNLNISAGCEGARLTHKHSRQFHYVRQSLLLWREVLRNFLQLWHLADQDLLDAHSRYRLQQTGQGLNRLQACNRVQRAFDEILIKVQREVGGWIGSSAVHLGDKNVPNALMFIDKYTQIPRIVNPLIQVVEDLPRISRYPGIKDLIEKTWGGQRAALIQILRDFFRHAFDGSGADNFFDAGSCIDGRLTSAWNWCSVIEKKPYYPLFLLSGFTGFDGKF